METETNWLRSFIGHHVTAITGAVEEHSETGTLAQIGDGWLQIAKDNGENVLIPSSAIRIVKLLDMNRTVPAIGAEGAPPVPQNDAPLNNPNVARFPDGY